MGGLQVGGVEGAGPQLLKGLKSKEKWRGGIDHLLPYSWVDDTLPSSAPSPDQAEDFSCTHMAKPGLSWYMEKIISCLSIMKVFKFEMLPIQ